MLVIRSPARSWAHDSRDRWFDNDSSRSGCRDVMVVVRPAQPGQLSTPPHHTDRQRRIVEACCYPQKHEHEHAFHMQCMQLRLVRWSPVLLSRFRPNDLHAARQHRRAQWLTFDGRPTASAS